MVALLLLSYRCIVTINVLLLFLAVPWAGLQCVIVVFPDHTHLSFAKKPYFCNFQGGGVRTPCPSQDLPMTKALTSVGTSSYQQLKRVNSFVVSANVVESNLCKTATQIQTKQRSY